MTNYRIPFNITFEDKVIGGKLSIRQALWFAVPVIRFFFKIQNPGYFINTYTHEFNSSGALFFIITEIVLFIAAFLLSFLKVSGVFLDHFLVYRIKFLSHKNTIKRYE